MQAVDSPPMPRGATLWPLTIKFSEHRVLKSGEILSFAAAPNFSLKLDELFAE